LTTAAKIDTVIVSCGLEPGALYRRTVARGENMKRWMWIALAVVAAGTAHAQAYKWVDKNGRVGYGDTPPPGAKATPLRPVAPPASAPPAAASGKEAKDDKNVKKGPLTPVEKELEFRRRMKEAQEAAAKADRERKAAEEAKVNCENSRQSLRTLESGQRVMRIDSKGERYYISDAQREQDIARAREATRQWCK
jgi:hypothetical protein